MYYYAYHWQVDVIVEGAENEDWEDIARDTEVRKIDKICQKLSNLSKIVTFVTFENEDWEDIARDTEVRIPH